MRSQRKTCQKIHKKSTSVVAFNGLIQQHDSFGCSSHSSFWCSLPSSFYSYHRRLPNNDSVCPYPHLQRSLTLKSERERVSEFSNLFSTFYIRSKFIHILTGRQTVKCRVMNVNLKRLFKVCQLRFFFTLHSCSRKPKKFRFGKPQGRQGLRRGSATSPVPEERGYCSGREPFIILAGVAAHARVSRTFH